MGTIIVEQFNPESQCWNKLYEIDESKFDAKAQIMMNKYDGPYRTRLIGVPNKKTTKKSIKKSFVKKKGYVPKGKST